MGRREGKCGGKKGSSQKVRGEQTRGLGKAPKAARGRSMKARPTQSRKGVKGGLRPFSSAPCRVKGQRPLWGLGQRPNCSSSDQSQGSRQQRRRQRSVPASNFARPQTRPQAALPSRFREEPKMPGWRRAQSGEGLFGFAVVLPAPRAQRAFAAQGVLGLAHPSTVENQPVVRVAPPVLRN